MKLYEDMTKEEFDVLKALDTRKFEYAGMELLGKAGVKGCVAVGADADLLVLDEKLDIDTLFAKGKVAILDKQIVLKGRFE